MNLNIFDLPFEHYPTDSLKYSKYQGKDIIPLWLAESDFEIHDSITKALQERISERKLGYPADNYQLKELISERCLKRYNWKVSPDWITFTPGITKGINIARAVASNYFDKPVAGLSHGPVYHRLWQSIPAIPFENILHPLFFDNSRWQMDIASLNTKRFSNIGIFHLCNPHNPVGRVYQKEELERVANICKKNNWLILSDEAHCDLTLFDNVHVPIASLCKDTSDRTITLMSPGKTFNISGLEFAFSIIENDQLRKLYRSMSSGIAGNPNLLGFQAATAAYRHADEWLKGQKIILERNFTMVFEAVNNIKNLSMAPVEGGFLAWISIAEFGIENPVKFFEDNGLGLAGGEEFGDSRFVRMNFACNINALNKSLMRFSSAFSNLA